MTEHRRRYLLLILIPFVSLAVFVWLSALMSTSSRSANLQAPTVQNTDLAACQREAPGVSLQTTGAEPYQWNCGPGGGGGGINSLGSNVPWASWIDATGPIAYFDTPVNAPNQFLATPVSGPGILNTRPIDPADVPDLDASKIQSGVLDCARMPVLLGDVITNPFAAGLNCQTTINKIRRYDAAGNTTVSSVMCGGVLVVNSASPATVTINSLTSGCFMQFVQLGTGQISFAGTMVLSNAHGFTKTFGQYAVVGIIVTGTNAAILHGDGA